MGDSHGAHADTTDIIKARDDCVSTISSLSFSVFVALVLLLFRKNTRRRNEGDLISFRNKVDQKIVGLGQQEHFPKRSKFSPKLIRVVGFSSQSQQLTAEAI